MQGSVVMFRAVCWCAVQCAGKQCSMVVCRTECWCAVQCYGVQGNVVVCRAVWWYAVQFIAAALIARHGSLVHADKIPCSGIQRIIGCMERTRKTLLQLNSATVIQ